MSRCPHYPHADTSPWRAQVRRPDEHQRIMVSPLPTQADPGGPSGMGPDKIRGRSRLGVLAWSGLPVALRLTERLGVRSPLVGLHGAPIAVQVAAVDLLCDPSGLEHSCGALIPCR
jgi:hypothetical protein